MCLLLGPRTEYPAHHHPAAELYIPLGPADWAKASAIGGEAPNGADAGTGSVIHHPPNLVHATRTHDIPLAALYLWAGDLATYARLARLGARSLKIDAPLRQRRFDEEEMAKFSFLHAADLHLGSPFEGLSLKDEELARRFAAASREAFRSLVDAALAEKVAFVVIAGDIYEGEWRDASIGLFFNRELARLDRAGIGVFLLKGNHDAESVVTKSITLPPNVREFQSRAAQSFRLEDLKVVLHGRSFPDRIVAENYALAYPPAVPGWFNIGVLHTSCTGRPPHDTYAPCTVQELATRGYHYWALGHVHAHEILSRDPFVVYPGNLQGRNIRETGPKGAVLVEVEDGVVLEPRRLILDKARWARRRGRAWRHCDEEHAMSRIEEAFGEIAGEAGARLVAVRVELLGATPLNRRFAADRQRLLDRGSGRRPSPARGHLGRGSCLAHERAGGDAPEAIGGRRPRSHGAHRGAREGPRLAHRGRGAPRRASRASCRRARFRGTGLADELDTLMSEALALVLGRLEREER